MDQDVDLTTRFSEPEVIWNAIFVEESRRSLISRIVDRRYRSGQGFVNLHTFLKIGGDFHRYSLEKNKSGKRRRKSHKGAKCDDVEGELTPRPSEPERMFSDTILAENKSAFGFLVLETCGIG